MADIRPSPAPGTRIDIEVGTALRASAASWLADFLARHNSTRVVSRGHVHYPAELPRFVTLRDRAPIALATYRIDGDECEIVTLHSDVENIGAGSALLERVVREARKAGCRRLWLITTNDNTHASASISAGDSASLRSTPAPSTSTARR